MAYGSVSDIMEFTLMAYYLESDRYKILVDTGGTPPDGKRWQPYSRLEGESLDQALAAIGVAPEDIDTVILTHLHWDHASNNHLFPKARFFVQRKEYDYLTAPEPAVKNGFDPDLVMKTNYEFIDGDCEIVEGVSVVLTPGHSAGMQCVVVETTAGKYVLGGDLITLFVNWEAIPHIPNGVCYDLDLMVKSMEKVDKLHGTVLPGHDEKVFAFQVYPNPA